MVELERELEDILDDELKNASENDLLGMVRNIFDIPDVSAGQSLPGRLAGFSQFLSNRGYFMSDDFLPDFFRMYSKGSLYGTQMEDLEPVLRPMVVKEPWQDADFHEAFKWYIEFGDKIIISKEDEAKINQKIARQSGMETQLSQANDAISAAKDRMEKLWEKMEKDAAESSGKQQKAEEKARKEYAKVKKSYEKLLAKSATGQTKDRLLDLANGKEFIGTPRERQEAENVLKEMLKGAISCTDYKEVMAFVNYSSLK